MQGTALLLGIHGAPGEGKTYQCEMVFREIGAHVEYISGGELEHHTAGEPAARIRRAYEAAAHHRSAVPRRLQPAVVFINDIDAGIGDWGDKVQYTVNRQNVYSELMHLADFPHDVHGRKISRVPIVVTANDMTKMYGPFTRLGRMTTFEWLPTAQERAAALGGIFPDFSPADRAKLVDAFPEQNIAFFAALRARAQDDQLWQAIRGIGVRDAFAHLTEMRTFGEVPNAGIHDLVSLGQELATSADAKNHLEAG